MKLHPILRAMLRPMSPIYGAAVQSRLSSYRSGRLVPKKLKGVVISVGNLTVGGTGKTPFVLWLAEQLREKSKSVGILSRGYKGKVRTDLPPLTIPSLPGKEMILIGDEPQLMGVRLGGRVKIGIGADRYEHGAKLEKLGVQWFVLDDGFQHVQLARDVDILLLDDTVPLRDEPLLPAGRLREPLEGIARADLVIITRASHSPEMETLVKRHNGVPILYAQTELRCVRELGNDAATPSWLGRKLFAFSAIGNPDAFYADLARWGIEVVGHSSFRDHHHYTAADLRRIHKEARKAGADGLVCTEKDIYNLGKQRIPGMTLFVCEIDLRPADEKRFWSEIRRILARKRPEVTW